MNAGGVGGRQRMGGVWGASSWKLGGEELRKYGRRTAARAVKGCLICSRQYVVLGRGYVHVDSG